MTTTTPSVLIAGAGPTGLTAAIELARLGLVPVVIDRKASASTLSRAVGILPSSLRLLGPSGVAERLLAEGVRVRGMRFFAGTRERMHLELSGAHPESDFILALAQDRTEDALRDALTRMGGSVRYGSELASVRQSDAGVVAVTSDGEELACDYLIGADGAGSATRAAVGIAFPGFDLDDTWSIADVDVADWRYPGEGTVCLLGGGEFAGLIPLEAERYRAVSSTVDALAAFPFELNVTRVRREGQFRVSVRQAESYRSGRVFLAGDAAHCHSPIGGRGMNLGIADAAELAQRLVAGTLDAYSDSRHAIGAGVIGGSERARKLITSTNPLARGFVRSALFVASHSSALRRRAARGLISR